MSIFHGSYLLRISVCCLEERFVGKFLFYKLSLLMSSHGGTFCVGQTYLQTSPYREKTFSGGRSVIRNLAPKL